MLWRAVVRQDPAKGEDLEKSPAFEASTKQAVNLLDTSSSGEHSLSGHEINRFFLNLEGDQFEDLSGLSGMAHIGDGRSVVRWDYDHDGWPDLASINANAPKLVWYRNQLDQLLEHAGETRHFLALRFVGQQSNRDGYGVRIVAEVGDQQLVQETRCGEGFSAQQSKTILLGLGDATKVDRLSVRWPSGTTQQFENLDAGQLVRIQEGPSDASALTLSPYGE